MNTLSSPEESKPQEVVKPTEITEGNHGLFPKARGRFTSLADGIRKSFGRIKQESSESMLGAERSELDILSQDLVDLNSNTEGLLGLQQESGKDQGVKRVSAKIQELQEKEKAAKDEGGFPLVGMLGDSDKIEGHQIDLVKQPDRTVVYFKTTSMMTDRMRNEVIPSLPTSDVTDGPYEFERVNGGSRRGADGWVIKIDEDTTVYVSKGSAVIAVNRYSQTVNVGALMGAVKIEVRGITDGERMSQKINNAFQKLEIPDALTSPDKQAEDVYKAARIRWQHRLEDDQAWQTYKEQYKNEHGVELTDHMQRREVYPNYCTMVDEGAQGRYQQDGTLTLVHALDYHDNRENYAKNTVLVLKHGITSGLERAKRGIVAGEYHSIGEDFSRGGADSVFIRTYPDNAGDELGLGVGLLINPAVLDRTDWYAYKGDLSGITHPYFFDRRPSPEKFFESLRQDFNSLNEIVMRRGIPVGMIEGIVVPDKLRKKEIIRMINASGIQKVNGTPLDKFVRVYANFGELRSDAQRASNST